MSPRFGVASYNRENAVVIFLWAFMDDLQTNSNTTLHINIHLKQTTPSTVHNFACSSPGDDFDLISRSHQELF